LVKLATAVFFTVKAVACISKGVLHWFRLQQTILTTQSILL